MSSALDQISVVAIGYAGLITLGALAVTVVRRPRPQWLESGVWILEMLMAVRVVAGVGSMLNGQRPDELSAHVGYLVASVCILPIAMESVADDKGPWSNGVLTVAAVAVTVIAVRLLMTWGSGG